MTAVGLLLMTAALMTGQLAEIRKETDPLKRFDRAIDNAVALAGQARQIVRDGGSKNQLLESVEEIADSTELALQSLRETGKKPNKLTKQYKKGELRSRDLVRQMNDLAALLGVEDRPPAEKARDRVAVAHEEFLLGVMSGK